MAIPVRGFFSENSSHCSRLQPTLTWQFQSGVVIPEKSSHCSRLQPTLTWKFLSGGNSSKVLPLQPIAAHSYMAILVRGVIPEKSSHCSPLQPTLIWQFQSGGISWKDLPLQHIVGNSWKVLPLQPIAAHSHMAISVKGQFLKSPPFAINCSPLLHGNFSWGVISETSSHCSALRPISTWQFQSGGNSWKVLPLQPIAAHSYMAISVRG